jgi:hypothetical protein
LKAIAVLFHFSVGQSKNWFYQDHFI